MGKPAARMGDTTAHGGSIILGNPTILIGKMPASTLGDMHVCPMCTGPVPHVGGPILLGSMGVLIGKKPAARISDMAICVGPPSMPVIGCMTVLIGEVGSGSQAGSAGAAASAQAAKAKGPKAIEAYPLGQPPETTESHEILVEFKDSAGKPLSGIFYSIKDPDSKDIVGCSSVEGTATHGGYAKKGSYELNVPSLSQAKWKKPKLKMGEEAEFSIEAEVPDTVKTASIIITESRGALRRALGNFELPIKGKKIEGKWLPDYTELESHQKLESENTLPSQVNNPPEYTFTCVAGGLVVVSDSLKIADVLNIELLDGEGKGIANADYEIALPGGEIRTGKLDGNGKAQFEDLEPGGAEVRFPNHLGKEKTP